MTCSVLDAKDGDCNHITHGAAESYVVSGHSGPMTDELSWMFCTITHRVCELSGLERWTRRCGVDCGAITNEDGLPPTLMYSSKNDRTVMSNDIAC